MKITTEPPCDQWIAVLRENLSRAHALHSILGEERVARIRQRLADEASHFTEELQSKAKSVGIPLASAQLPSYEPGKPVVSVGHQPLIYHWGLLYKNQCLSRLAGELDAFAFNSIIDTDVGDAGRFLWPRVTGNLISIQEGSIAEGPELYLAQRISSRAHLKELCARVLADLEVSGVPQAVETVTRVFDYYERLSGESVVVANALIRWVFEERRYVEVPLSRVVRIPEVAGILNDLVRDYRRFVTVYNETLDQYRLAHRIKNVANPFPNMKVEGERMELPLWEVSDDRREPLSVDHGKINRAADTFIAPRGSIVTLLMRGYCSDIAVHGLGGARYDPFVDAFTKNLLGVDLPRYVVASATKYLFPDVVARYERARDVKARYKEMVSHTEKFFGQGLFSGEDELALEPLARRRVGLLDEMKRAGDAETRSSVAHQLNALNREIKTRIDSSAVAPLLAEASIDDAALARWACREYPFFFTGVCPKTF